MTEEETAAKLAEWGLSFTEAELQQLAAATPALLRWQAVIDEMLRSRELAGSIVFPGSEPLLVHAIERPENR